MGIKNQVHFTFASDQFPGFNVFCDPETIQNKEVKQIWFEYHHLLLGR